MCSTRLRRAHTKTMPIAASLVHRLRSGSRSGTRHTKHSRCSWRRGPRPVAVPDLVHLFGRKERAFVTRVSWLSAWPSSLLLAFAGLPIRPRRFHQDWRHRPRQPRTATYLDGWCGPATLSGTMEFPAFRETKPFMGVSSIELTDPVKLWFCGSGNPVASGPVNAR